MTTITRMIKKRRVSFPPWAWCLIPKPGAKFREFTFQLDFGHYAA